MALRISTVNGGFNLGGTLQLRVNNGTVSSPTWYKSMGSSSTGTATVAAENNTLGLSVTTNGTLGLAYDFTVSSSGLIVSGSYSSKQTSTERNYFQGLAYYDLTTINDIRLYNASAIFSAGTYTLTEL
jgi:hypothetical protein